MVETRPARKVSAIGRLLSTDFTFCRVPKRGIMLQPRRLLCQEPGRWRRDVSSEGAMNGRTTGLTYAQSGVDIDAGNAMVERIKPLVRATRRAGADGEIGGFWGGVRPKGARLP